MNTSGAREQGSAGAPGAAGRDDRRSPQPDVMPHVGGPWPTRWDLGPFRWDLWPVGADAALHDPVLPAGALIPVEQVHEEGALLIRAELPGVDPHEDVDITVEDGLLTIVAQREERSKQHRGEGYRSEFRYGRFERQLRLPQGAGVDDVSATYRDGVLEVRVPIPAERSGGHKVEVRRE